MNETNFNPEQDDDFEDINSLLGEVEGPPEPIKPVGIDAWLEKARDIVVRRWKSSAVVPARAHEYYRHMRQDTHHNNQLIPLGVDDAILYEGFVLGGVVDRDIGTYLGFTFADEYSHHDIQTLLKTHFPQNRRVDGMYSYTGEPIEFPKKADAEPIFGGLEAAFAPGKVVLDLGSGRAVGLMQFAEKYPQTTFIGVDNLYQERRTIFPKKPGLQLTYGDWFNLSFLPSNSVDTIISVQGVTTWGIDSRHDTFENGRWQKALAEYHRVLKKGGIIRFDPHSWNNEVLQKHIDPAQWEVPTHPNKDLLVIRKR